MSIVSEINRINTNIANAYTQCSNKSATMPQIQNSANLADTIASISSGGGTTEAEEKDVNFYDYDGTRVYSYTKSEFLNLSAMPANPTHEGLTAQGWNWTLSYAKTHVTNNDKLDIGQLYIPSDGSTKIYVKVTEEMLSLYFNCSLNGTATINWGDNTTSTITGTSMTMYVFTQHTYSTPNDYVISVSGTQIGFGGAIQNCSFILSSIANSSKENYGYVNAIKKIELGNVVLSQYAFKGCCSLETITMSTSVTFPTNAFLQDCLSLKIFITPNITYNMPQGFLTSIKKVVLARNVKLTNTQVFYQNYYVEDVVIPNGTTSLPQNTFWYCRKLKNITIPNSVTSLGASVFADCYSLRSIKIPNSITSLPASAFRGDYALLSVICLGNVTSLDDNVFYNCYSLKYIDFSHNTSVPTTLGSYVFSNIPSTCKIVVPDSLYESWISASNWSTYSSYIIKKSDWDAL